MKKNKDIVCYYDNPQTLRRERYYNKYLIEFVTLELIVYEFKYVKRYEFSDWNPGHLIGNPKALPDKLLKGYMES